MKKEIQNKVLLWGGFILSALILPNKSMAGTFFDFDIDGVQFWKDVFDITLLFLKDFWFIWLPFLVIAIFKFLLEIWLNKRRKEKKTLSVNLKVKNDITDLKKLSELRDEGIITEEEFQKKKNEILGL